MRTSFVAELTNLMLSSLNAPGGVLALPILGFPSICIRTRIGLHITLCRRTTKSDVTRGEGRVRLSWG